MRDLRLGTVWNSEENIGKSLRYFMIQCGRHRQQNAHITGGFLSRKIDEAFEGQRISIVPDMQVVPLAENNKLEIFIDLCKRLF